MMERNTKIESGACGPMYSYSVSPSKGLSYNIQGTTPYKFPKLIPTGNRNQNRWATKVVMFKIQQIKTQ